MPIVTIESLDHEGKGVAHQDGKAIFVEGALPGETVEYSSYRRKKSFEMATAEQILRPSAQRVQPRCKFFGLCGGCSMQHMEPSAQVAIKQRVLEDSLWHLAHIRPEVVFPPIHGPTWGYRYRARISVRCVPKKGGVLVGFHERRSSYIADMQSCEILPPEVGHRLMDLRALIAQMSAPDRIPQIEIAFGDDQRVLVLRNLQPLEPSDHDVLKRFGENSGFSMWLQPGGPDTVHPLEPDAPRELHYTLPEFDLRFSFRPTDFTQVNVAINRLLIRRAMQLLDPRPGERIADLFCGLGNFSLPICRRGAHVIGVEGGEALVERAAQNAAANGLSERSEFLVANLFEATEESLSALGALDKLLIDPPREGAIAVVKALTESSPSRIVYVSCNPATLARDAAVLIHEKGYRLKGAGVANMFPHTSHVESIALFDRD